MHCSRVRGFDFQYRKLLDPFFSFFTLAFSPCSSLLFPHATSKKLLSSSAITSLLSFVGPLPLSRVIPTLPTSVNSICLKSELVADLGKPATRRGPLFGQPVHFFLNVSKEVMFLAIAVLSDSIILSRTFTFRRLHSHNLLSNEKSGQVTIGALQIPELCKTLLIRTLSSRMAM